MSETPQTNFRLSEDCRTKLEKLAKAKKASMRQVVEWAVDDYWDGYRREQAAKKAREHT